MKTDYFGDTGLKVSRMGLGLAALGRPGYINLGHGADLQNDYSPDNMQMRTHQMLDKATAAGINYIDAAQSYGKSEDFLSAWLKQREVSDVIVGSKWGYTYTADWQVEAEQHEVKEHSIIVLNRQWRLSDRKLSPALKLYQVHSATFDSGILENAQVLDRLAEIQDSGILIGLTLSGPTQAAVLAKAMKVSVEGKLLFDVVQATSNILEHSCDHILRQAADRGMGIIIKEALANGRLTDRNKDPQYARLMAALTHMAEEYVTSIDAIALAYVLSKSNHHVVLSGAVTEQQLQANLDALRVTLTADHLRRLDEFQLSPSTYWDLRSQLSWN